MIQTLRLPIRTVSESNDHEHWRSRQKRAKAQRGLTALLCRAHLTKPPIPCRIKLTRIAPRKLDQGNYPGSLKHVQDGVADWIGIDDRHDHLVTYEYDQKRGQASEYAVIVELLD